jgi:signal transduction histidine kinase
MQVVTTEHGAAVPASTGADTAASPVSGWGSGIVIVFAGVVSGASVAVVAQRNAQESSFASTSSTMAILDVGTSLVLVLAAGTFWLNDGRRTIGALGALISITWAAPDWVAWTGGPALVRSTAMVIAPFLLVLVIHLGLVFETGRPRDRLSTNVIISVYAVTAVISVGWALLRDPFRDRYCTANCTVNSFLVHSAPPLSRVVSTVWLRISFGGGLAFAVACVWQLATSSSVARRSFLPVLGGAAAVGLSQGLYAAALIRDPVENPHRSGLRQLFLTRAVALIALAAGLLWTVLREQRTRRSLAQLATDLTAASPVGSLTNLLARSLGDEHLKVIYCLAESQTYVDAQGQPVEPRPNASQTITTIQREAQPIALVIHDRTLAARPHLERDIGAAARLAVDNERLRAQTLAQLAELQASRRRIVETADNTRRQLEHNLHDGAQQSLLALSYKLRLAETQARKSGDVRLADTLGTATDKAASALEELRDLAHGIFPVILTEAGLGPALQSFLDLTPIAVELVDIPNERFPDDIEIALYILITELVTTAAHGHASHVTVSCTNTRSEVRVHITDDLASSGYGELTNISDRIGALGGLLDTTGPGITAVIPCA